MNDLSIKEFFILFLNIWDVEVFRFRYFNPNRRKHIQQGPSFATNFLIWCVLLKTFPTLTNQKYTLKWHHKFVNESWWDLWHHTWTIPGLDIPPRSFGLPSRSRPRSGISLDYNMTVWIWAGNYISFTIAAGLIRLHMPGVKKSRV